jgi:serine/threonine protein kinase/tetratricopeptide (TPR) repeat protein
MSDVKADAKAIFLEALDCQGADALRRFLEQACGSDAGLRTRVEELLRAHRDAGAFLGGAEKQGATCDQPNGERPGTVIGPYKLLQQIGEGGMGTVWMAEQSQPVQRKVALKVIKAGMDSRQVIARFEAERQALAMMDHVNISRVFDGGATEAGRPYFVMELVHGVPITKYCDDNRLTPRERLELFVPVCQAIQHAHQKGIIHRDIKPFNVMVTLYDGKPVPKVIDFGVAKAIEQRLTERTLSTQYGTMVGTLEYMSPEQAEMDALGVDTRSDIYSLGVLLYELLTGSTPLTHKRLKEADYAEVLRMIKEEEPPRPSTRLSDSGETLTSISAQRHMEPAKLRELVRGELDWIVMKALDKDRNRRYETASGLAADVRRHLNDEPVQACPPSPGYRLRKFARRNKGPVLAASLVLMALVAGIIGTTWGMLRATVAEAEAVQEAGEKTTALDEKEAALATAMANEIRAKAAQKDAQENLKDAIAAVDQMLTRVGDQRLKFVPQMEPVRRELLQDALTFYLKFLEKKSDDPVIRREAAMGYLRVARIQYFLGQYPEAEKAYRNLIRALEDLDGPTPLEPALRVRRLCFYFEFAGTLAALGKDEEAMRNIRRAVEMAEKLAADFPDVSAYRTQLVSARNNLAGALIVRQPDEAEKILRRTLPLADGAWDLEGIHRVLGEVLLTARRFPEAEEAYRQALKHAEKLAAESPAITHIQSNLVHNLRRLATVLAATQRPREAEKHLCRAILVCDQLATSYQASPHYRNALASLQIEHGEVLKQLGRPADAEKAYRLAVEHYEKLATDFPTIPMFQQAAFDRRLGLGQLLVEAGRTQEAQQVYTEAATLSLKLPAEFSARPLVHWRGLVRSHIELGRVLESDGSTQEAEAAFRQALAIQEKLQAEYGGKTEYRREVARSHLDAALQLRFANRHAESEKLYRRAVEHFVRLAGESPQSQEARQDLAFAYFELADFSRWAPGRLKDSEKAFRQALEQYEKLSAEFPDVPAHRISRADCRERLASVLVFQGRLQEAEQGLKEALALAERLAQQHPADRIVRMTLAMGSRHWGETLWRKARPQEVEKPFRRAEAILDKLVADFPQDSWCRFEWGVACQMLVTLLARDLKQPQAAERFYRRAVAIFEKLAAEFPREILYRWWLADAHREWAFCLRDNGRTLEAKEIFDLAIASLSRVVELRSKDFWGVWYPLALLHLSTGRSKEYRTLCETLLQRFGQTDDPDVWVGRICSLAPDAVADPARPVQIAEKSLARHPHDTERAGVLGETLYRKGDLDAAVGRLEASIRAAPGFDAHRRKLFLAMAYHRLGRTAKAQQLLQVAVGWIEKNGQEKLAEGAELREPLPWSLRLDLQLLRREAEELMVAKEKKN